MAGKVRAIPEGFHTATPYLMVKNADAAIGFYKKAFGAEEVFRMPGPDGKSVMHAELKIGDSLVMLADEFPGCGGTVSPQSINGSTVTIHLYVEDVDASFKRASSAGANPAMPPADMFWGDRFAKVVDPYGHHWAIATHKQDLTPEQIGKGAQEFFASMAGHK